MRFQISSATFELSRNLLLLNFSARRGWCITRMACGSWCLDSNAGYSIIRHADGEWLVSR